MCLAAFSLGNSGHLRDWGDFLSEIPDKTRFWCLPLSESPDIYVKNGNFPVKFPPKLSLVALSSGKTG